MGRRTPLAGTSGTAPIHGGQSSPGPKPSAGRGAVYAGRSVGRVSQLPKALIPVIPCAGIGSGTRFELATSWL